MVDAFTHLPVAVLSLNPAVDITYEIPKLIADQKVHALDSRYDPGGYYRLVTMGLAEGASGRSGTSGADSGGPSCSIKKRSIGCVVRFG